MILPHSRSENFATLVKKLQDKDTKDKYNPLILPNILPRRWQLAVAAYIAMPHTFPTKNNIADTSQ
jgi:hypothetical protein